MQNLKKYGYEICFCTILVVFFAYFYRITSLTPLAGDDWGYALNGMKGNPFFTLIEFYQNWSGRLVAEFWGLVVAPRKQVWNLLNAFLFTGIAFFLVNNTNCKKRFGSIGIVLFLIFTVSEFLRMETYTWIMGTTYVIPLFLSLMYFYTIEIDVFNGKNFSVKKLIFTSLLCLINGVTMENIAAMMIVGHVLILIYFYVKNKRIHKGVVCNLMMSVAGFMVMRMSPGSTFRTIRDHSGWMELSLFEKIEGQLSNFFTYTFIENKYLIFGLALMIVAVLISKGKQWLLKNKFSSILIFVTQIAAVFFSCANVLASKLHFDFLYLFLDPAALSVRVWWLAYVVLTMAALCILIQDEKNRMKSMFYLMMAGGCNLVMLYSPIFGSRSSIYFVFFMMAVVVILYNQIVFPVKIMDKIILIIALLIVYVRASDWMHKYEMVHEIQMIREGEIEYYRHHPTDDAWICRMPPYSVHGADIEADDVYHQEVFREYYGLDSKQNLIFYWKDSYE